MTTPPATGRLAWAQSLSYDATEDRAVITALSRGRTGTLQAVSLVAGAGLQMILRGGWLAVASCDDLTNAVVGSREDHYIQANPGPASGSREDWLWCETHPEEGTWELKILPAAQAAVLPGLQLARIIVPQGANLASQMTIVGTTAELDRRLLAYATRNFEIGLGGWSYTNYGAAAPLATTSEEVWCRPGQWYRIRFTMIGPDVVEGTLNHAIGIGWRQASQPQNQMVLARAFAKRHTGVGQPSFAECEWSFRYLAGVGQWRVFDGRYWMVGNGLFRMCNFNVGEHAVLTVEDMGT